METILAYILGFGILVYSVILHEIAHGFVAEKFGDPTAKHAGRLTLNPIPHIDPLMTIAIPVIMYITTAGSFVFGSARPVPVNPLYFNDPKKDMAIVAAAGVLTNFGIAVIAALLFHLFAPALPYVVNDLLLLTVRMNVFLGIFNLIPIPPLDGSKVLAAALPRDAARTLLAIEQFGFFILIFLLFTPGFSAFLSRMVAAVLNLLNIPYA